VFAWFNPIVACTTTSAERCVKTSVSRAADFVPDLYPRVSQDPAKTGRHECSSSRLCTAAPVQTISKSHSLVFCVVGISIADGRWGTQWCRRCAINKTSSPASAAVIAVQSVYDADQVRQLRGRTSTAAWQREAVQVTTAQMVGRGSCCTNWKMCDLWGIGCLCKMTASANNISSIFLQVLQILLF